MIIHSPESAFSQERAKWEQDRTPECPNPIPWEQGGRYPRKFEMFPFAMPKAGRPDPGGPVVIVGWRTVHDENERMVAKGQGFCDSQEKALEAYQARDLEVAKLAAERNFHERRMSPQAQAEARLVDQATSEHVASIPEQPIKRRGRKPKAAAVS